MHELTTNQKGAIAEVAIAKAAFELGVEVYRPMIEGGRYDLIFGLETGLLRVQCKWAPLHGDVVVVRCYTSRRAKAGVIRRLYTSEEIDAIAAFCPDLNRCFFIPFSTIGPSTQLYLRIAPSRNNQRAGVRNATDFDFVARLTELIPGP